VPAAAHSAGFAPLVGPPCPCDVDRKNTASTTMFSAQMMIVAHT